MITDSKKWHYLAVKSLSALLKGVTSNHKGDFYRTRDKLEKHENACKDHDYCYVEMSNKDNNILKYNHVEKSMKVPFIIYADMGPLLEKMSTCHYSPKVNKHTTSGYSLFIHCSFDVTKNNLDYYRGQDYMKKFCKDVKEHGTKIINYKKMIPLSCDENKSYKKQKVSYICKKEFSADNGNDNNDKEYYKVRDHCHYTGKYRGATHNISNLRYKTPKKITVIFHNGST